MWQPTETYWVNQTLLAMEQEAKRLAELERLKKMKKVEKKHTNTKRVLLVIIISFVVLTAICCLVVNYTDMCIPPEKHKSHEIPEEEETP